MTGILQIRDLSIQDLARVSRQKLAPGTTGADGPTKIKMFSHSAIILVLSTRFHRVGSEHQPAL
jgi:hypothetical protein